MAFGKKLLYFVEKAIERLERFLPVWGYPPLLVHNAQFLQRRNLPPFLQGVWMFPAVGHPFLRGKGLTEDSYARRLEPEIKLFRFEKSDVEFGSLPKEKQEDEVKNIRNGLNYAKKVLNTGECDMLILDEVLGLIGNGIITVEDLKNVLSARDDETDIIMTGVPINEEICTLADYVTEIRTVK